MKKLKNVLIFLGLGVVLVGCALPEAEDGEDGLADYFTRVLEFSQDVDNDSETEDHTVITRVYNDTKKQATEVVNAYDTSGVKTKTETWDFDNDGNKPDNVSTYTEYTYFAGGDHDGDLQQADTYDSEDTLIASQVVDYPQANYQRTIYYALNDDGSALIEAQRTDRYYYPSGAAAWAGELRMEKYFIYDTEISDWKLKKEKAYWYEDKEVKDTEDPFRISHELSHSFRGEDDPEEVYIYKPYSYTDGDKVYLESDFEYVVYDDQEPPNFLPDFGRDAYDSFAVDLADPDDPFRNSGDTDSYNIEYDLIGEQKNMTVTEYNERDLIAREAYYTGGTVQEVRSFEYNAEDKLINMSRYVNKGQILEEKIVIGYREKTLGDGQTYNVKESLTYRFSTLGEDTIE
jgi:hypothetical protein